MLHLPILYCVLWNFKTFFSTGHCFPDGRKNSTHLEDLEIHFENPANPRSFTLNSPKFYVPESENDILPNLGYSLKNDIMIIKLETKVNDIDPVGLPSYSAEDFYFIENKKIVFVTLRNEDKQKTSTYRHEKCTEFHVRTGYWCYWRPVKSAWDKLSPKDHAYLSQLQFVTSPKEKQPLIYKEFCTTEYQAFSVSVTFWLFNHFCTMIQGVPTNSRQLAKN